MFETAKNVYEQSLDEIRNSGLWKDERIITSPQGAAIEVGEKSVLNFCANNYLGLSSHPKVIEAAHRALDERGYGLSSVRFICGTQDIHKKLERAISEFLGMEDTILYSSCFDANGGLFETLLGPEDAVISDELNHASIIDGVRLCKAKRMRFKHDNMEDLEAQLVEAKDARVRLITTDGVFSMDGDIAQLDKICELADKHAAMVHFDDCHATGFVGQRGRGTHELKGVMDRVDIITSTLGKALGGASGGFTAARKEIVDLLRNRSRPYLFSNTVAPPIVYGSLAVIELLSSSTELNDQLGAHTERFRSQMTEAGFDIRPGTHPIVPIMLGEAKLAVGFAAKLLERGIYVVGFSYPVVPNGKARIRVQLSAAHTSDEVDRAIEAFTSVGRELGIVS